MTIKRTYCADDSVIIASTSALELIQELHSQAKQGLAYVPDSLVTKTPFNPYLKISVKSGLESVTDESLVQWTHHADGTSSAHSLLGDALLSSLSSVLTSCEKLGSSPCIEQVTILTGVNSVKLSGLPDSVKNTDEDDSVEDDDGVEPLFDPSPSSVESVTPFDLSVALSKETKDELCDYVAAYDITLDKRRSLAAMKGELETIIEK